MGKKVTAAVEKVAVAMGRRGRKSLDAAADDVMKALGGLSKEQKLRVMGAVAVLMGLATVVMKEEVE